MFIYTTKRFSSLYFSMAHTVESPMGVYGLFNDNRAPKSINGDAVLVIKRSQKCLRSYNVDSPRAQCSSSFTSKNEMRTFICLINSLRFVKKKAFNNLKNAFDSHFFLNIFVFFVPLVFVSACVNELKKCAHRYLAKFSNIAQMGSTF